MNANSVSVLPEHDAQDAKQLNKKRIYAWLNEAHTTTEKETGAFDKDNEVGVPLKRMRRENMLVHALETSEDKCDENYSSSKRQNTGPIQSAQNVHDDAKECKTFKIVKKLKMCKSD